MLLLHNASNKYYMSSACMGSSTNRNHMTNLQVVIALSASSESSPSRGSCVRKINRYNETNILDNTITRP
jgi:hypothetical protein